MNGKRIANLDLIRASAITAVVIHHIFVNWSETPAQIRPYTHLGSHGVDLFFVLSGWLIGGLCWHELKKTRQIDLPRFVLSRAFRTVPPYMAALVLSYAAVHFARGEQFYWQYLFFVQNYFLRLPFFLISWSLCIEEQFYLALPLALKAASITGEFTSRPLVVHLIALSLVLLSPVLRITYGRNSDDFGYYNTATHFRLEGLALGVWAAYIFNFSPVFWRVIATSSKWFWAPAIASIALIPSLPQPYNYWFSYLWVSLAFASTLIHSVQSKDFPGARNSFTYAAAIWSYSIYLTHALVLNFVAQAALSMHWIKSIFVFVPLSAVLIALVGAAFYYLVERPSLGWRSKILKLYDLRKVPIENGNS